MLMIVRDSRARKLLRARGWICAGGFCSQFRHTLTTPELAKVRDFRTLEGESWLKKEDICDWFICVPENCRNSSAGVWMMERATGRLSGN
jgi:hypothetical protein